MDGDNEYGYCSECSNFTESRNIDCCGPGLIAFCKVNIIAMPGCCLTRFCNVIIISPNPINPGTFAPPTLALTPSLLTPPVSNSNHHECGSGPGRLSQSSFRGATLETRTSAKYSPSESLPRQRGELRLRHKPWRARREERRRTHAEAPRARIQVHPEAQSGL